jgi:hypothetical protein
MLTHARRLALPIFDVEVSTWERHPDWRYRIAALEHRARATDADGIRAAETFIGDTDPRIRTAALQRLASVTADSLLARVRQLAVRASADRHRSPLVLRCIEDHLAGQRFPLDVIHTDSAVANLPPLAT